MVPFVFGEFGSVQLPQHTCHIRVLVRTREQDFVNVCFLVAIIWCIWVEHDARIFKHKIIPFLLSWDGFIFPFSRNTSNDCFKVVSMIDIQWLEETSVLNLFSPLCLSIHSRPKPVFN